MCKGVQQCVHPDLLTRQGTDISLPTVAVTTIKKLLKCFCCDLQLEGLLGRKLLSAAALPGKAAWFDVGAATVRYTGGRSAPDKVFVH